MRDAWIADGGGAPWAIGISAPGPLDPVAGLIIDPPNLGETFRGLELGPRVSGPLGIPFALERDTNVAILGETSFGASRGFDDVVYLTVSTGVGGAVITGGRLLSARTVSQGSWATSRSPTTARSAAAVASATWSGSPSSGSGMARSAREALAAGADAPILARLAAEMAPRQLEAIHVDQAAAAGDPTAVFIVERAVKAFASAMASIVDVFDPDRVVVGAGSWPGGSASWVPGPCSGHGHVLPGPGAAGSHRAGGAGR